MRFRIAHQELPRRLGIELRCFGRGRVKGEGVRTGVDRRFEQDNADRRRLQNELADKRNELEQAIK